VTGSVLPNSTRHRCLRPISSSPPQIPSRRTSNATRNAHPRWPTPQARASSTTGNPRHVGRVRQLAVGSLFGFMPSPETHIIPHIDSFRTLRTFIYSLFVLEYHFAPSVHVHSLPSPGSGQAGKNTAHFPSPLSARVPAASSFTPVTNPSRAVGATRAHHGLRRHVPPLVSHTHAHTFSLSLFSLFLSGSRTLLGSWDYPSNSHVDQLSTIYYPLPVLRRAINVSSAALSQNVVGFLRRRVAHSR